MEEKIFQERKGLQTQEMVRCESCGRLHPLNQCTELIIKVIVGKDCDINNINIFPKEVIKNEAKNVVPPEFKKEEYIPPKTTNQPKSKSIVPPGIAKMMMEGGSEIYPTMR